MRRVFTLILGAALLVLVPQGVLGSDPEIVFSGPRTPDGTDGIWIMDRDGSNVEWVHETGGMAEWSPDGSNIVFEDGLDILRINLATRLTDVIASSHGLLNDLQINYARLHYPVWSPRERRPGVGEIAASTWIAGPDGEARSVIVVTDEWGDDGVDLLYVSTGLFPDLRSPTWSPGGTQIATFENIGETSMKQPIIIDRDSGNVSRTISMGGMSDAGYPEWSRDVDKIAFTAGSPRQNITIYVLDLDSGTFEPIVAGRFPSWSPDDTQLVFSTFNGKIKRYTFETAAVETLGAGHNPCWMNRAPRIEDFDCDPDEICCDGSCVTPECVVHVDCDDGDPCTTDTCGGGGTCMATCGNTHPVCGLVDGCCGPTCDSSNDPDCPDTCIPTHSKEKGPRCTDGIDNDCDGDIDGDDTDC